MSALSSVVGNSCCTWKQDFHAHALLSRNKRAKVLLDTIGAEIASTLRISMSQQMCTYWDAPIHVVAGYMFLPPS